MANKLINELPMITGNEFDAASVYVPVQSLTGTHSVSGLNFLQASMVSNRDLYNKCNVLLRRLEKLETAPTHIIINQYYGGALKIDSGSVSHAFIELYNPTDKAVSLEGKSIHYFYSTEIHKLDLTGSIPAKCSFFIKCKLTNDGSLGVAPVLDLTAKAADMEWDIFISNKCITIALMDSTDVIAAGVNPSTLDSYIDMIGSTDDKNSAVPFYEMKPAFDQSKQRAIRRILFTDTNNNFFDCESLDYRLKEALVKAPRNVADGAWELSNIGR